MGTFGFIIAIIVVSSLTTFLSNWQRARYGYPITDELGNEIRREEGSQAEAHEKRIEALEKRLSVLERIATDRGARTADEIEALRDLDRLNAPDTGVPSESREKIHD